MVSPVYPQHNIDDKYEEELGESESAQRYNNSLGITIDSLNKSLAQVSVG